MSSVWTADWAWSLPLTGLTLIIHGAAVIGIGVLVARVRMLIEKRHVGRVASALLAIAMLGVVGWMLAILLGLEAAIWASTYLLLHAIDSPADAMLYSLGSLTTLGSPELMLEHHWRLMGTLEAANGVLLFGISTAFVATVLAELRTWIHRLADSGKQ